MVKFNRILLGDFLALIVCGVTGPAVAQVTIFHSPGDNGAAPAQVVEQPAGPHTLHLYLATGTTPSPNEPCNLGTGDEVCQWVIHVSSSGPVTFQSFSPVGDVRWNLDGTKFTATGGDFALGQLGRFKLGDLAIDSQGAGSVSLAYGEVASANLNRVFIKSGDFFLVPEPGLPMMVGCGMLGVAGLAAVRGRTQLTQESVVDQARRP